MSDPWTIREMAESEIDVTVSLWRECGLTRPWNNPEADARLALTNATSTVLLGRVDHALAASVMVGFDGHRGWVYYLAVGPSWRGAGRGAQMMRAAEAWLRGRGAPKLELMVRIENASVAGFYRAIGYSPEPVTVFSLRL